uniref:Transmembrane protein n=1 Tax=viral metagenome TaxID=1070528 RepID=A0A6C0BHG0_9ZZZZ
MLAGTQLDFAYNTLDSTFDEGDFSPVDMSKGNYDVNELMQEQIRRPTSPKIKKYEEPVMVPKHTSPIPNLPQGLPKVPAIQTQYQSTPITPKSNVPSAPQKQSMMYDAQSFNKQFEQEQQINAYLKQLQTQAVVQQQPQQQIQSQGYFDKLFSKKKEFFKLLQWVLIIVLAISIHHFIEYYVKHYININDFTFERELFVRALYPFCILFILWNLRVFAKP